MFQFIGSVGVHGVPQTNWHKTLVSALGVAGKRRLQLKRKSRIWQRLCGNVQRFSEVLNRVNANCLDLKCVAGKLG